MPWQVFAWISDLALLTPDDDVNINKYRRLVTHESAPRDPSRLLPPLLSALPFSLLFSPLLMTRTPDT